MKTVRRDFRLVFRYISPAIIGIGLLVAPNYCRAANNCPWINEATASGLLGGNAVGELTTAGAGGMNYCEFIAQSAGYKRTLRVSVEVAPDTQVKLEALVLVCGIDAVRLKAIGNDAFACAAIDQKSGQGERIIGRVRDQLFTIAIFTTLKNDPVLTRETLRVRINAAAELVAGNLF
ncbi:MAG: hypothetical protein ABR991_13315 [Terracidiphilus sp.]|jgi:hypothetical protein